MKISKCKNCIYCKFEAIPSHVGYYCQINHNDIPYPSKMGGMCVCKCYKTHKQYRKEIIQNYEYPDLT